MSTFTNVRYKQNLVLLSVWYFSFKESAMCCLLIVGRAGEGRDNFPHYYLGDDA